MSAIHRRPVRLSRRGMVRRLGMLAAVTTLVAGAACVNVFWKTTPRDISVRGDTTATIKSPVKAHLRDGSTVVFLKGGAVSQTHVNGVAQRYRFMAAAPNGPAAATSVPLDSIVGLETFQGVIQPGPTALVSIAATVAGAFATAGLAVAIFGSCPTLYADTGVRAELQAEGFSYAIGPLFRQRDVDPLTVARASDGIVRLELRNEALETHYIDHLELARVTHGRGELVVPDQHGRIVALSSLTAPQHAVDRDGRDVQALLRASDGQLFETQSSRLARAYAGDLDDWIDVETGELGPGDSVAVVLRLRNSLLNTVLLYEGMLSGPTAPDWLAQQLRQLPEAMAVGRWYTSTMGLRVSVDGVPLPIVADGQPAPHARIGDVGPLAFRDVAVVLPRPRDRATTRIRLRFVADNWRIDQLRIASQFSRPVSQRVSVQHVKAPTTGGAFTEDTAAVRLLTQADQQQLETRPGQRMVLEFLDTRPTAADSATRYLVTWQGWYHEWIRPSWITSRAQRSAFVPGDSAVSTALTRWRTRKVDFERQFYSTRIPTR